MQSVLISIGLTISALSARKRIYPSASWCLWEKWWALIKSNYACVILISNGRIQQLNFFNPRWRFLLYDKRRQAPDRDVLSSAHSRTLWWRFGGGRRMSKCIWNIPPFHTNWSDIGLQCTNNLQKLQKSECKFAQLASVVRWLDIAIP